MSAEVLQEYLVKLGFDTDKVSLKKFEDGLGVTSKKVLGFGAAVVGVVASVEAATIAFAYSMRNMYFQSEVAGTTVENLKSMEFAGKQVGISVDAMAGSIDNMGKSFRLMPGKKELMESFGVKVDGRDTADVMLDFVKKTKKIMPEWQGALYAQQFGMDADTYLKMRAHPETFEKGKKDTKQMYKDSGVDPEKTKANTLALAGEMDQLEKRFDLLHQAILNAFVTPSLQFLKNMNEATAGWTHLFAEKGGMGAVTTGVKKSVGNLAGTAENFLASAMSVLPDSVNKFFDNLNEKTGTEDPTQKAHRELMEHDTKLGANSSANVANYTQTIHQTINTSDPKVAGKVSADMTGAQTKAMLRNGKNNVAPG